MVGLAHDGVAVPARFTSLRTATLHGELEGEGGEVAFDQHGERRVGRSSPIKCLLGTVRWFIFNL